MDLEVCKRCIAGYVGYILNRRLSLVCVWTGSTFLADHSDQFRHATSDWSNLSIEAALSKLTGCWKSLSTWEDRYLVGWVCFVCLVEHEEGGLNYEDSLAAVNLAGWSSDNSRHADIESRVASIVVAVFSYAVDFLLRRAPQHR